MRSYLVYQRFVKSALDPGADGAAAAARRGAGAEKGGRDGRQLDYQFEPDAGGAARRRPCAALSRTARVLCGAAGGQDPARHSARMTAMSCRHRTTRTSCSTSCACELNRARQAADHDGDFRDCRAAHQRWRIRNNKQLTQGGSAMERRHRQKSNRPGRGRAVSLRASCRKSV